MGSGNPTDGIDTPARRMLRKAMRKKGIDEKREKIREKYERRAYYRNFCTELKTHHEEFTKFFFQYTANLLGVHHLEKLIAEQKKMHPTEKGFTESNPWKPPPGVRQKCPDSGSDTAAPLLSSPSQQERWADDEEKKKEEKPLNVFERMERQRKFDVQVWKQRSEDIKRQRENVQDHMAVARAAQERALLQGS
eukprot:gene12593-1277_t